LIDVELKSVVVERSSRWQAQLEFSLKGGEWLGVIGPSGSGKSTLLDALAGFATITEGKILFNGGDVTASPTHKRGIGLVMQQNTFLSHLTISQNLLLAIHHEKMTAKQKLKRISQVLEQVRLGTGYLPMYPHQVSGGELARLNLCRAMLRPGSLLLLDEPFASLDEALRHEMNGLVRELHASLGLTTICVTHHQEDALLYADKLILLMQGRIAMEGTSEDFAERPISPEVAEFMQIGSVVRLPGDGACYYVKASEFFTRDWVQTHSNVEDSKWCKIALVDYRQAITGASRSIVDLRTRHRFRVNQDLDFRGELWFDRSRVLRFG
jgi:ABC-type Fe3+/spermidine/putrescine transport system ATPase subunit